MSLDVGEALSEGVDRTFRGNGLVLLAVFVVFGLANAIVQQSRNRVQLERIDFERFVSLFEAFPYTAAELREFVEQATPLAYLDGLSLATLFALTVVAAIVAEAIRIVAVRTFASEETETIPRDLVRRNLAWATLNGVVGGIVVGVLIVVGLLLLVLPGLFLLVAFYFVRQEIAIEDANFVDAMANSWELTKGSRFRVLGLAIVLLVIRIGGTFLSDAFFVLGPTAGSIASVLLSAVIWAYSVSAVTRAYEQLADGPEADEQDDLEPYLDDELDDI